MNRHNFFGHLSLAVALVLVAAFAGQVRRWHKQESASQKQAGRLVKMEDVHPSMSATEEREHAGVIVRFRPGTSVRQIERLAASLNDRVEDVYEHVPGYVAIADEDGLDADAVVNEYMTQEDVEWAEKNFVIEQYPEIPDSPKVYLNQPPAGGPDDPLLGEQWALINTGQHEGKPRADISALQAWTGKTTGSDEVVVAVLDSGVNYTHPDLMNNVWMRPPQMARYADAQLGVIDDEHGYNAVENNGDPMDDNGHGTHCAGIIGAEGNNSQGIAGVNWKVQIMPLKFMDAGGSGTTSDAIEAINYVIARKQDGVNVRVISASWGSTMRSRGLEAAIRRAYEAGILFVAAAGNSSVNNDRMPHYPSSYAVGNVVAVAALDRRDQLASFSNYGAKSVHIGAPGKEILSTWLDGEFKEASGTSMATPVVAGIAALVLSVEPNLTVDELRQRLLNSADALDALQGKVASGGRINAARAVGASAKSVAAP